MKTRFTFIFSLIALCSYGQSKSPVDSIVDVVCKALIEKRGQPDSVRVAAAFEEHLFPFADKYSEVLGLDANKDVFYRLQKRCPEFQEILERVESIGGGDWQSSPESPTFLLKKNVCRKFVDHKKWSYLEPNGDIVQVVIRGGKWTETFLNGTQSILKFQWSGDCEFELEFVESNNESRKHYSVQGDKYYYILFDKKDTYYDVLCKPDAGEKYVTFKMYF